MLLLILKMNSHQKKLNLIWKSLLYMISKLILLIELDLIMTFSRLSKTAGRYERDPTQDVLEKTIKDTIAFASDKGISNALDYCLKFKGEERKV